MASNSNIEWTDASWNCLAGCEAISPGCALCYAATMTRRLEAMGQKDYAGLTTDKHFNGKVRCLPHKLDIPLRWKKPRRVFVNSMSDLFHEDVPDEFIDRVFAVMNATRTRLPLPTDPSDAKPWHVYQVLTKRAERMFRYMESRLAKHWPKTGSHPIFAAGRAEGGSLRGHGMEVMNAGAVLSWPPRNIWLGVSVERQQEADERIPLLLQTPAAVRFLSCEPLLGPVDLSKFLQLGRCKSRGGGGNDGKPFTFRCGLPENHRGHPHSALVPTGSPWFRIHGELQWVIVGGESGHGSRACDLSWIRSIVEQCKAAGVSVFVKQLGSRPMYVRPAEVSGLQEVYVERKGAGKWGDPSQWPEELRVRQFPRTEAAHAK